MHSYGIVLNHKYKCIIFLAFLNVFGIRFNTDVQQLIYPYPTPSAYVHNLNPSPFAVRSLWMIPGDCWCRKIGTGLALWKTCPVTFFICNFLWVHLKFRSSYYQICQMHNYCILTLWSRWRVQPTTIFQLLLLWRISNFYFINLI